MTQQYRYNTETKEFIEDKGNLGIFFYEAPWVKATQEEIDSYLLQNAKEAQIYHPVDYNKNPTKYCSMTLNDNPYFDLI